MDEGKEDHRLDSTTALSSSGDRQVRQSQQLLAKLFLIYCCHVE